MNSKSTEPKAESPTTEKPAENETKKPVETKESTKNNAQVPAVTGKKKSKKNQNHLVMKKSKFMIPPETAKTLTPKEREKMLKEIVVEAFVTAAARNHRAETNKWLRWKYAGEDKQVNKWLEGNGVEDMGWAVGRRIYEKEEIEVWQFEFPALFEQVNSWNSESLKSKGSVRSEISWKEGSSYGGRLVLRVSCWGWASES